jgi:hypothetical protein
VVSITFTYDDVVSAIEGAAAVPAWAQLGEVLERRGGWRFQLDAAGISWWRTGRRRQWATAEGTRFVVWHGRAGDDDEVAYWELDTVEDLDRCLNALDRRCDHKRLQAV